MSLPTPKLSKSDKINDFTLYPYYAGYSHEFVNEVLQRAKNQDSFILDPWSGTGLTCTVAKTLGCQSLGVDINPVMTIIAKANNIHSEMSPSIQALSQDIIRKFKYQKKQINTENDPLSLWFVSKSVALLRKFELIIYKLLVKGVKRESLQVSDTDLSSLASFFYIALFKLVKSIVKSYFSSSNPTWIKVAKAETKKIEVSKQYIIDTFTKIIESQLAVITSIDHFDLPNQLTDFVTASSKNIPLEENSVDYILTSPPYCTRIDYAVAMRPELAVLGLADNSNFKQFRQHVIGSPTVQKAEIMPNHLWGGACNTFLSRVKEHSSVASATYYHTTLLQYFNDMYQSFEELARVCKPNSQLDIVVQDSFYKELHNNLPLFFEEMLSELNFFKEDSIAFKSNSFNNINPKSAKYKKSKKPQEFYLSFKYNGNLS